MNNVWLVSVVKDIYEEGAGVEIAGIFTTEEKAYEAKAKVIDWLDEEEYEDYEVFVKEYDSSELDVLNWYELEEKM